MSKVEISFTQVFRFAITENILSISVMLWSHTSKDNGVLQPGFIVHNIVFYTIMWSFITFHIFLSSFIFLGFSISRFNILLSLTDTQTNKQNVTSSNIYCCLMCLTKYLKIFSLQLYMTKKKISKACYLMLKNIWYQATESIIWLLI